MLFVLPLVLFFSYYPVISLGSNETMNFELSLPIIWLVLFDVISCFMILKKGEIFNDLKKGWMWLIFPVWLTVSVIWSVNSLRGLLVVGMMWLIVLAIYAMLKYKDCYDEVFKNRFLKWFLGASLVICIWCFLQCVFDLVGMPREQSLLCEGCTYEMFGFPHPNGFAIEPQFMGNLLLAPIMVTVWMYLSGDKKKKLEQKKICDCKIYNSLLPLSANFLLLYFFVFSATLFLTFSRGAIYAFGVGMLFLSMFVLVKRRKKKDGIIKRLGITWGVIVISFLFTLNVQGIMAEVSSTNDTYGSGIAKVLNHLSLGLIDIRDEKINDDEVVDTVEKDDDSEQKNDSIFDGYVVESTETRVRLTNAALEIWSKNPKTMIFGVGLGGAGEALFENGLSPAPKEIIQNQYASLLLETGLIGVLLFIWLVVMVVKRIIKESDSSLVLTLIVTYGVTLCFFSGLPNALQIYLLLGLFISLYGRNWCHR